jgi:hypothetical protein
MTLNVVGNVIEFDGYHIARISTSVPATVRGRFEDCLNNAYEDNDEVSENDTKSAVELLDGILQAAKDKSEAGMVELADVETILNDLKAKL